MCGWISSFFPCPKSSKIFFDIPAEQPKVNTEHMERLAIKLRILWLIVVREYYISLMAMNELVRWILQMFLKNTK
jgi:hypothetical protein